MDIDLEQLLAPVSDENPAGPDLCYDDERAAMDTLFERSFSSTGNVDSEFDWRRAVTLIVGQAKRTQDIWLPVYLCRAGARGGQLDVVATGAQYLAGMFELYWDTLHPQIEEYGLQGRKAPCESLANHAEFLRPLREMPLIIHPRLGSYSGDDIHRFAKGGTDEDGFGMFRAAVDSLEDDSLQQVLDRIDAIRDGIRRADAVMTAQSGSETGTNFAPTYEAIESVRSAVAAFVPGAQSDDAEQEDGSDPSESSGGDGGAGFSGSAGSSGGRLGQVDSREDVARAIDAILDYYRRREPGSPIPVLLGRARGWINADFLTLLEDIAPTGLDEVRRVLTSRRDSDE